MLIGLLYDRCGDNCDAVFNMQDLCHFACCVSETVFVPNFASVMAQGQDGAKGRCNLIAAQRAR